MDLLSNGAYILRLGKWVARCKTAAIVVRLSGNIWACKSLSPSVVRFNVQISQLLVRVSKVLDVTHYCDAIIGIVASQITSLTIVYTTVYSDADQSKHQSCASLAFVWGIHRGPVNSPHKWPVTRKMFPFDDVIMNTVIIIVYPRVKNFCANAVLNTYGHYMSIVCYQSSWTLFGKEKMTSFMETWYDSC